MAKTFAEKYATSNSEYYFVDTDIDAPCFDIDSMQTKFDTIEEAVAAAKKWHERTDHNVSIRHTYTVDVEVVSF